VEDCLFCKIVAGEIPSEVVHVTDRTVAFRDINGQAPTHVLDALRALPQRQREVLALRYYLELSEAEIADALGISRGAVKSHASRGSATLRSLLEEEL
jgi:DNA-directed RNA polymerase specialized sigma24 family protein